MNFTNLDSSAISDININGSDASITFKGSGKTYNYTIASDTFVEGLVSTIEANQSVGRYVNRAIREDQTLRIVAV